LALSEWKLSLALAQNQREQARVEYVEGWGIELLNEYRALSPVGAGTDDETPLPNYPQAKDAIASFRAAVQDDPKTSIYWESLGDLLVLHNEIAACHCPRAAC